MKDSRAAVTAALYRHRLAEPRHPPGDSAGAEVGPFHSDHLGIFQGKADSFIIAPSSHGLGDQLTQTSVSRGQTETRLLPHTIRINVVTYLIRKD